MGKQKDAKNKKDKSKGYKSNTKIKPSSPSQKRVVGLAYLRAFMKPTPSTRTQNVDLTIINILLSIFAILLSIIIEIVKDQHDKPVGLDNMLGAVSLFSIVVAVFITHALIGPKRHSKWQLWQPFLGGWRFVTLQSVAWSLLAISLYLSGLALHPSFEKIYPTQLFGASFPSIWTLNCLMGLLAEILLISSLPLFESPIDAPSSIQLRWNDVGTINIIVSVIAMLTFFFLEKLRPLHDFSGPHVNQILTGAAGACIIVAIVLTHMIVGKMCHGANWKWWQAFEGGWRFVLMQGVSWCLFSLAILVGAWSVRNTVILEGTWTITGTLGFLSELLMVISIQMYLPASESANASPGSTQAWMNNATVLGKRARRFLVTVLLFNVFFAPIMVLVSIAIPFMFASAWVWGSVVTLVVAVYAPTFFLTSPHKTGAMSSAKLRTSFLVEDVIRYFNGRLVKTADIDPSKQYIFGYHPHGILPIAAMWATNSQSWSQFQSSTRETVTLIATHLFCIPVTREFLAAAGAREVSKFSFNHALGQGKSVVLVPGGMKEMRESLSTMEDIVVCKSHKGFIKMAITHGVDLVPLFSFGETKLLDCAFPELQKFCWKNLGIPFPLFVGRWGLPVPRPQQVTILVGPAIHVTQNSDPSQEEVDAIADEYFTALGEMFEKHKHDHGHGQSKIIWK